MFDFQINLGTIITTKANIMEPIMLFMSQHDARLITR